MKRFEKIQVIDDKPKFMVQASQQTCNPGMDLKSGLSPKLYTEKGWSNHPQQTYANLFLKKSNPEKVILLTLQLFWEHTNLYKSFIMRNLIFSWRPLKTMLVTVYLTLVPVTPQNHPRSI